MRHLLVLTEQGVSPETAVQWKDQLQERLGIPVIVLAGAKQALIVDTTAVDEAK